jgi:hypothetical protein
MTKRGRGFVNITSPLPRGEYHLVEVVPKPKLTPPFIDAG